MMKPGTLVRIIEYGEWTGMYGVVIETSVFQGTGDMYAEVYVRGNIFPFMNQFLLEV